MFTQNLNISKSIECVYKKYLKYKITMLKEYY